MERLAGAYAWNSLIKSARLFAAAPTPSRAGEPMIELRRGRAQKYQGESVKLHGEQAVSREQALRMFTINAAYAAFEENTKAQSMSASSPISPSSRPIS